MKEIAIVAGAENSAGLLHHARFYLKLESVMAEIYTWLRCSTLKDLVYFVDMQYSVRFERNG